MSTHDRLSPQDAAFLYAESPVGHMHVGSLAIFEDSGLTQEALNEHIDRRLDLVPRFRKRLEWVPLDLARPLWVDDQHFDVRFHVRHTGLPRPAGERELLTLVGRLMSLPLDRTRPLWELWVVDLPESRKAIIQKTHHAMIDGASGIDLATVLLDFSPDAPPSPAAEWRPRPAPSPLEMIAESVTERLVDPRQMIELARDAVGAPRRLVGRTLQAAQALASFGRAGLDVAPRTSLSRSIGAHRRFEVVRMALDEVKEVKNRHGCTVNDVVLALVAGGLRELLVSRDESVRGLTMRAAVPVSVRDESERMTYGNRVAVMFADLPVGEADPELRLARVREQMQRVKESQEAVGAEVLIKLADFAPPTILSLGAQAIFAKQWLINLSITNVPGPQFPLYLRGGRLLEVFPYAPLLKNTGVGVAVLSYDGHLGFGLSADWEGVPDLAVLAAGIRRGLEGFVGGE